MHFINEQKGIFHGDLSIRNILVTDALSVKISDFGLSQDMSQRASAGLTNQRQYPIKWMAYEVLSEQQGSLKSDIWSFGVVMWEIFTLGKVQPYGGQCHRFDKNTISLQDFAGIED